MHDQLSISSSKPPYHISEGHASPRRQVVCKGNNIREEWRVTCREARADITQTEQHRGQADNQVQCLECLRTFRRESDMKRHKCVAERCKPVHEQQGAVQCSTCKKWFKSPGGFTVHSCNPDVEDLVSIAFLPHLGATLPNSVVKQEE